MASFWRSNFVGPTTRLRPRRERLVFGSALGRPTPAVAPIIAVLVVAVMAVAPAGRAFAADTPVPVAVFPFEIDIERQMGMGYADFSGTPEEQARLLKATEKLKSLLLENAGYKVLAMDGLKDDIAKAQPLFKCNGCDADLAKKVNATQAITGTVQKSSATLMNISIFVRDVASGEIVNSMAVSVRQNTDAGWLRGVRWLVRNRLVKE